MAAQYNFLSRSNFDFSPSGYTLSCVYVTYYSFPVYLMLLSSSSSVSTLEIISSLPAWAFYPHNFFENLLQNISNKFVKNPYKSLTLMVKIIHSFFIYSLWSNNASSLEKKTRERNGTYIGVTWHSILYFSTTWFNHPISVAGPLPLIATVVGKEFAGDTRKFEDWAAGFPCRPHWTGTAAEAPREA